MREGSELDLRSEIKVSDANIAPFQLGEERRLVVYAFGRHFKRQRNDQRDRKADDKEKNYEAHNPIRNVEKWKNLAGNLHQQPGDNAVRDRNLVNVAPLQLGEERRLVVHGFAALAGGGNWTFNF